MFCLVYLQHHKDQLEVVIWVKDHLRKVYAKKINILAFFTKKVPLNSQAFEFVTKITLKFEVIDFEPEKNENG